MASARISLFRVFPAELFRVNNGRMVALREWTHKGQRSYDIVSEAGKVKPKALDPQNYTAPNGASMRPNGSFQQQLVASFRGDEVLVYSVPAGTQLPNDLILVHEHTDHYSLQAATEMTVQELNMKISQFLARYGQAMTKEQWLQRYSGSPAEASGSSKKTRR